MYWELLKTIVPLIVGIVGTIFACWSFFWTRKHKILDTLADILREYVTGIRRLTDANNARRKAEALRHSFPNGGTEGEAQKKANELVSNYDFLIEEASKICQKVETEIAANTIKFPRPIRKALTSADKDLFRFGALVNQGQWDAADIQAGKVKDRYKTLVHLAVGWRIRNPLKLILGYSKDRKLEKLQKGVGAVEDEHWISEDRMKVILDLIHKRMSSQMNKSFSVHPPQEVIDNPQLLKAPLDLSTLKHLKFKLVFQDGEVEVLTFPELMVFTHQLIFLAIQKHDLHEKLTKGGFEDGTKVHIETNIVPQEIMKPSTVEALLQKIEFSPIPAERL